MKKLLFLIASLCLAGGLLFAQEEAESTEIPLDTTWRWGGISQINLNQVALVNWSAGGANSFSTSVLVNMYGNFKKGRHIWDNLFIANWGLIVTDGEVRKNEDRLELNSVYGYELTKSWYVSGLFNFKSQYTPTFEYLENPDTTLRISKFGAPAFMQLGAGITYKPFDWLSVYASPATGKFTFVRADPQIDETTFGLEAGDNFRGEFGAYISAVASREIIKNVSFWTKLDLYNNYTDPNKDNRVNIDVDWQFRLDLKVNKFLSASIQTQLIYDDDIDIPIDTDDDGVNDDVSKRIQFREALGVALVYKFDGNNGKKLSKQP
jgi:hypothetical protein